LFTDKIDKNPMTIIDKVMCYMAGVDDRKSHQ